MMTKLRVNAPADLEVLPISTTKNLIYKNIKFELYTIDEDGRIFSKYKNDFLTPTLGVDGYLKVVLFDNGIRYYARVASIVAYTFIGAPPIEIKDPTINHKDNNRLNNNYKNIEWMERSLNSSIRKEKGIGESNNQAILNWNIVKEIRQLYKDGFGSYQKIAAKFGVSKSCIALI